ncbi:hypothetical protein ACFL2H_02490 [Planctomycetota bacterium]
MHNAALKTGDTNVTVNPYASPTESDHLDAQSVGTSIQFQTFRGKIMPFVSTEAFRNEVRRRAIVAINSEIGPENVITVSEHSGSWPYSITVCYRVTK